MVFYIIQINIKRYKYIVKLTIEILLITKYKINTL
jgi:hypothetical protein